MALSNEAIKEYTEATGKTIKYGVFAISQSNLDGNDVFDENGNKVFPTDYDIMGNLTAVLDDLLKDLGAGMLFGNYDAYCDRVIAALEKALSEINELETTKLEADVYDRYDEHFQAFLVSGVVLLFAALSLSMFANRRLA